MPRLGPGLRKRRAGFPVLASPLCAGICPVVENHRRRGSMEDKDQDPRKVQRAVIRDGTKDLLAGGGMPIRRMSGSDRPPPASRGHLCPESRGGSPEGGERQRASGRRFSCVLPTRDRSGLPMSGSLSVLHFSFSVSPREGTRRRTETSPTTHSICSFRVTVTNSASASPMSGLFRVCIRGSLPAQNAVQARRSRLRWP